MCLSVMRASLVPFALFALAACGSDSGSSTTPTAPTTPTTPGLTFKSNPCGGSGTVQLTTAQTARIDCSGGGTTVTLAGAGASYLIVPEFATDQVADNLVS